MPTLFDFLRRPKLGKIQYGEAIKREVDFPTTPGRLKGVIISQKDGEVFFYSYEEQVFYVTFFEYGEWAGMVCEAKVEQDESFADSKIQGYAYQLFVRSLGDRQLYELPTPDVIRAFPKSRDCRCPFCMIESSHGYN